MSSLMREMGAKALKLGIPLSVHLDLTYRCNERCIHCYLDHEDHGEMTTAEILGLLDQLAGRLHRTTGRDQVIDQQDALPGRNGVDMHFNRIGSIFQRVLGGDGFGRQLAGLADRHKTSAEAIGHRGAENKPA